MSSAMEQLAAELAKLSAEEWARLPEPQIDGVDWDALLTEVVDANATSATVGCKNIDDCRRG